MGIFMLFLAGFLILRTKLLIIQPTYYGNCKLVGHQGGEHGAGSLCYVENSLRTAEPTPPSLNANSRASH